MGRTGFQVSQMHRKEQPLGSGTEMASQRGTFFSGPCGCLGGDSRRSGITATPPGGQLNQESEVGVPQRSSSSVSPDS